MRITKANLWNLEFKIVKERNLEWKIQTVELRDKKTGEKRDWITFVMNNNIHNFDKEEKPFLGARFFEDGRLKFLGVIFEGKIKTSLYLHNEIELGLFKTGISGIVYENGILKLLSAWHDKTEPKEKAQISFENWIKQNIDSSKETKKRIEKSVLEKSKRVKKQND